MYLRRTLRTCHCGVPRRIPVPVARVWGWSLYLWACALGRCPCTRPATAASYRCRCRRSPCTWASSPSRGRWLWAWRPANRSVSLRRSCTRSERSATSGGCRFCPKSSLSPVRMDTKRKKKTIKIRARWRLYATNYNTHTKILIHFTICIKHNILYYIYIYI